MKTLMSVAASMLALMAVPAFGQSPAPAAVAPLAALAPAEPVDPARLVVAERIVMKIMPPGTYKRLMSKNFVQMMHQMVPAMGDLPIAELAQIGGLSPDQAKKLGDARMREVLQIVDPHWQERTDAIFNAVGVSMGDMMDAIEPRMRAGLSRAYARAFTVDQLNDLDRFFATPSGGAYAGKQFELFMDPEMMREMSSIMPQMTSRMPQMVAAIQKAQASVPPMRRIDDLSPAERARLAELLGVPENKLGGSPKK